MPAPVASIAHNPPQGHWHEIPATSPHPRRITPMPRISTPQPHSRPRGFAHHAQQLQQPPAPASVHSVASIAHNPILFYKSFHPIHFQEPIIGDTRSPIIPCPRKTPTAPTSKTSTTAPVHRPTPPIDASHQATSTPVWLRVLRNLLIAASPFVASCLRGSTLGVLAVQFRCSPAAPGSTGPLLHLPRIPSTLSIH